MDRVIIYIDSSNLYGRPLVEVKYFCVRPPEPNRSMYDLSTRTGRVKYAKANQSYLGQLSFLQQLDQWKKIQLIYGRLQRTASPRS